MTTIILVILGVLIAAVAALMVVYWGGDAWEKSKLEAEAGRLVSEGSQVAAALEMFYRQEGYLPRGADPIDELLSKKYLTHRPMGMKAMEDSGEWKVDYDKGMIRAALGLTDDQKAIDVCLAARLQLKLPELSTATGVYRCDGTDSPGGRLSGREPCCIGEAGLNGGTVGSGGSGGTPPQPTDPLTAKANAIIAAGDQYLARVRQDAESRGFLLNPLSGLGAGPAVDGATWETSYIYMTPTEHTRSQYIRFPVKPTLVAKLDDLSTCQKIQEIKNGTTTPDTGHGHKSGCVVIEGIPSFYAVIQDDEPQFDLASDFLTRTNFSFSAPGDTMVFQNGYYQATSNGDWAARPGNGEYMVLHPGPGANQNTVASFTAPAAGTYRFVGQVNHGIQGACCDGIRFQIGDKPFQFMYGGSIWVYYTKSLQAGEKVNFTVNNNGTYYADSTFMKIGVKKIN